MNEKAAKVAPSKLPPETQDLIKIIFDENMFSDQMTKFDIDVKQLPLGKLNKAQIAKGFDVLERLGEAIKKGNQNELVKLTSEFYTVIPHSFGRQRPRTISYTQLLSCLSFDALMLFKIATIRDKEMLDKKMEMLNVLNDIEIAQSLQEEGGKVPLALTLILSLTL